MISGGRTNDVSRYLGNTQLTNPMEGRINPVTKQPYMVDPTTGLQIKPSSPGTTSKYRAWLNSDRAQVDCQMGMQAIGAAAQAIGGICSYYSQKAIAKTNHQNAVQGYEHERDMNDGQTDMQKDAQLSQKKEIQTMENGAEKINEANLTAAQAEADLDVTGEELKMLTDTTYKLDNNALNFYFPRSEYPKGNISA